MAFKMKGSAFKLNNVATKSALAMKSPLEQYSKKDHMYRAPQSSMKDSIKDGIRSVEKGVNYVKDYFSPEKKSNIAKKALAGAKTLNKKSSNKMKSPMQQNFGYHNDDGSVNEDATANIPAAPRGYRPDSGPTSNLPEGVDPNAKMIRQTYWNKGDQKKANKLKKKEKRSSNRKSAMEKVGDFITGRNKVRTRRPRSSTGRNLVTGERTFTSGRTGRTRQGR